jgi:NAD-dependent deacetylase
LARFVLAVLEPIAVAEPNAGHRAIGDLEPHTRVTVVTQNVDGLHCDAGSSVVHEIHGSLLEIVTLRGRFVRLLTRRDLVALVQRLRRAQRSWLALARLLWAIHPMFGLGARGFHRPSVVMFGQAMAQPAWDLALQAARDCDLMITVGTSGMVMPAAMLPATAKSAGARIITVDPESGGGDLWLRGPAATVLPALVHAAFGEKT